MESSPMKDLNRSIGKITEEMMRLSEKKRELHVRLLFGGNNVRNPLLGPLIKRDLEKLNQRYHKLWMQKVNLVGTWGDVFHE